MNTSKENTASPQKPGLKEAVGGRVFAEGVFNVSVFPEQFMFAIDSYVVGVPIKRLPEFVAALTPFLTPATPPIQPVQAHSDDSPPVPRATDAAPTEPPQWAKQLEETIAALVSAEIDVAARVSAKPSPAALKLIVRDALAALNAYSPPATGEGELARTLLLEAQKLLAHGEPREVQVDDLRTADDFLKEKDFNYWARHDALEKAILSHLSAPPHQGGENTMNVLTNPDYWQHVLDVYEEKQEGILAEVIAQNIKRHALAAPTGPKAARGELATIMKCEQAVGFAIGVLETISSLKGNAPLPHQQEAIKEALRKLGELPSFVSLASPLPEQALAACAEALAVPVADAVGVLHTKQNPQTANERTELLRVFKEQFLPILRRHLPASPGEPTDVSTLRAERNAYRDQLIALGKNPLPPDLTGPVNCAGDGSLTSDEAR